jgi:hypothetical protein
MSSIEKAILGALGGLSAVLVKFLGQDYANVVAHASNLSADQLLSYKVGYGLLTPILMFLGAFVACLSDEQKRIKVVALAVAAPAMITTWSGGHKDNSIVLNHLIVPSAYAQAADSVKEEINPVNPDATTEKSTWQQIQSGVGAFFGYGKEPQKYWVIVGSYKEKDAAQQFADKINAEDKALNAWVGLKLPGNDYYPVIVGDYAFLSEAKELKRRALATKSIKDAYFSTGQRR